MKFKIALNCLKVEKGISSLPMSLSSLSLLSSEDTKVVRGFPGRLTRGAGTHLASWLQESSALSSAEGQSLLDSNFSTASSTVRGQRALAGLFSKHGKKAGHSNPISDIAYSGDILVSKDKGGMRLWRASGDFALLRCVSSWGPHVAIHESGQFIVTGKRGQRVVETRGADKGSQDVSVKNLRIKIWGPAGGSAFTAGKKRIVVQGAADKISSSTSASKDKSKGKGNGKGSSDLRNFLAGRRKEMKMNKGTGVNDDAETPDPVDENDEAAAITMTKGNV